MTTNFSKSFLAISMATLLCSGATLVRAAKVDDADAALLRDIAQANIAEVEAGKLAAGKSRNAEIKTFARTMVTDHTKALGDVRKLAADKGVTLPKSPDAMHKAAMVEFKTLRGSPFDTRYVQQAGVGDHESTEKLLQKTQADAKDADVKALAQKMLPVVQAHLGHARELAATAK